MQTASIMLALAGDGGNTVPKYYVTPAEVAVLQHIHGSDAVSEIAIAGDVKRSNREERTRLLEKYGRNEDGRWQSPAVDALFPGVAARVFETFREMELPRELFAAKRNAPEDDADDVDPLDHDADGRKGGAKPSAPTDALDQMTKAQLVEYAKANDIEIDASAKKDEVLAAIKRAESPKEAAEARQQPDDEDEIGDINDDVATNSLFK